LTLMSDCSTMSGSLLSVCTREGGQLEGVEQRGRRTKRERGATWGRTDLLDDALNVDRLRDILSLLDARHPARVAVSTCFNDARFQPSKGDCHCAETDL
jgi:hypothetical protein